MRVRELRVVREAATDDVEADRAIEYAATVAAIVHRPFGDVDGLIRRRVRSFDARERHRDLLAIDPVVEPLRFALEAIVNGGVALRVAYLDAADDVDRIAERS